MSRLTAEAGCLVMRFDLGEHVQQDFRALAALLEREEDLAAVLDTVHLAVELPERGRLSDEAR